MVAVPVTGPVNPHLALPLQIVAGKAATIEQDTDEHTYQQVEAVVRTPIGQRTELPAYGHPDVLFRMGGVDLDALQASISEWVEDVEDVLDPDHTLLGQLVDQVTVAVAVHPPGSQDASLLDDPGV